MNSEEVSKRILDIVVELEAMPIVFLEAMEIMKDDQFSYTKLTKTISKDIALSARILNLVNSAYFGIPNPVTKINDAISLLGIKTVKGVIMGMAMKPMVMTKRGHELWKHSIRCAVASEILSENLKIASPEEAFVIGLLHDVGRAIFYIYNLSKYKDVEFLINKGTDKLTAEQSVYKVDHAELGYAFAKKYQLPAIICDSIRYHHSLQNSSASSVTGIVYVAEKITQDKFEDSIFDSEVSSVIDFELSNPLEFREMVFKRSDSIIGIL